ncbi:hypothetical protein BH24BAC1_BH24BAC1_35550 [soil metagenome]
MNRFLLLLLIPALSGCAASQNPSASSTESKAEDTAAYYDLSEGRIVQKNARENTQQVVSAPSELPTSFVAKAKHSNKQVVWYEYPFWLDGTLLSDPKNKDKFNDILYKRVGSKYYKAQVEGAFNALDWGVKRDYEGGTDNSPFLQAMFDYFPQGYTASVYIPTGNYHFKTGLVLEGKPIHLFGDNGTIFSPYSTKLFFPANETGIYVGRQVSNAQEIIIENLCLIGGGGTMERDGISLRGRFTLRGITTKGFPHHGISVWANMAEGNDASGSLIEKCHSLENGKDGFFLGRTDANSITVIACDTRDNGRYGFNEDSFLGNNYISCMAHYNKAGDYFVRDKANNRSSFISCYSEGGNKVSQLGPKSTVVGGVWGTGYSLNGKDVLY